MRTPCHPMRTHCNPAPRPQIGECEVCCEAARDTALGCGHVTCGRCSVLVAACPWCRAPVGARLRLFV